MRFPKTKRDFEGKILKAYCAGYMAAWDDDRRDRSRMLASAGRFCRDNVFCFIGKDNLADFVKKHFGM